MDTDTGKALAGNGQGYQGTQPTWIVGENIAEIIRLALDDVLSDLEARGYVIRAFLQDYV